MCSPACSVIDSPSTSTPCICASRPRGLTARPTSTAHTPFVTRGVGAVAAVDLDEVRDDRLVLLVDRDALRGAGGHRPAPLADGRDLVEHGAGRADDELLAPERDRVDAQRRARSRRP